MIEADFVYERRNVIFVIINEVVMLIYRYKYFCALHLCGCDVAFFLQIFRCAAPLWMRPFYHK